MLLEIQITAQLSILRETKLIINLYYWQYELVVRGHCLQKLYSL